MNRRTLIQSAAGVLVIGSNLPARSQDGERTLFNGKDLSGWDGAPGFWSVRDGAITGRNTAENPAKENTFLIWRGGTLKDFELRLQWRIEGPGGNSGIQYRSKELGNWVVAGYQADIDVENAWTGIGYEERGRRVMAKLGEKVVVGPDSKPRVLATLGEADAIKRVIKPGEWNEYLIVARGNQLTHAINGRVTAEVIDDDPAHRSLEGILAFQLHSGPPMTVQFRKIGLLEL